MYWYDYMHVCMQTHRQTDGRTDWQTDGQTDRQTYTHTHIYIHTYTHTRIHTSTHAHIYTCMHTHIHRYMHTYTDAYTHAGMHDIRTRADTHIHILCIYPPCLHSLICFFLVLPFVDAKSQFHRKEPRHWKELYAKHYVLSSAAPGRRIPWHRLDFSSSSRKNGALLDTVSERAWRKTAMLFGPRAGGL